MKSKAFQTLINRINAKGRMAMEGYSLDMLHDIPFEERKEAEDLIVNRFINGDVLIAVLIPHLKYYDGKELLNSELAKCPVPSFRCVSICFSLSEDHISENIYQLLYQNYLLDASTRDFIIGSLLQYNPSYDLLCFFEKLYQISTSKHKGSVILGIFHCCGIIKDLDNMEELKSVSNQKKIILESDDCTTKKIFDELNKKYFPSEQFVDSKSINSAMQKNILSNKKIPYSASYPVIYKENGNYFLAVFVFFFSAEDIQSGCVSRPTMWVVADIKTGKILERHDTSDKEFSDAPYGVKYDIRPDGTYDISAQYYDDTLRLLDTVRHQIIENQEFDKASYDTYLRKILANIPKPYQRFYVDLSV